MRIRDCSIFTKVFSGYLALAVGLTVLTGVTSYLVMSRSLIHINKEELTEKALIIADIFTDDSRGDSAYARMRNIENLTEAQVIYIGRDMVARRLPRLGERPDISKDDELSLEQSSVIDALDVQLVTSILDGKTACDVRKVEFMGGNVLFAGAPVYAADHSVEGAAILYRPFVDIQSMTGNVAWMIAASCVIAGMASTLLAFGVSRWMVRPIQVLNDSARRMAQGHYGETVPLNQRDEIGQLGETLDHLSVRLLEVINALKEEKSKLEQILSGIGEGIVAIDQNGQVVHYNNAALELLETSSWLGKESSERKQTLVEMLNQAMITGERAENMWTNSSGRSIAAIVWPMTNEENGFIGAVGLLRDVSESQRLEQMRKDYVANISHELRTPLTGIRGMVEPLLDGYMDTEEEKMDCYRVIYQETMRLEKLIGEMLDLSRLQAGRAQVELEPMNVEGVLGAALRRMRNRAESSGVKLEIAMDEEALPQIMGNEDRILQVLIILLDNALSFTPSGGSVTIFARVQSKWVWLGVRDTGAGIDPADLPYIWERFYKADKSRMRTTGTGLGLTIAKLVVECMGGTIQVRSEPGKGAEFEFSLTVAEE